MLTAVTSVSVERDGTNLRCMPDGNGCNATNIDKY